MDSQIDSREAWIVTVAGLAIASTCMGAPLVSSVALKHVAADLGGYRSIPSAALSLAMLGTGIGGLAMGLLAERFGVRLVIMFGATMVCAGSVAAVIRAMAALPTWAVRPGTPAMVLPCMEPDTSSANSQRRPLGTILPKAR